VVSAAFRVALLSVSLALAALLVAPARSTPTSCPEALLPGNEPAVHRPVRLDDLVRLRDIGAVIGYPGDTTPFAISPDQRHVAFQIRRADVGANDYCLGMAVLDLTPGARPRLVDIGGEMIRWSGPSRNLANTPSGVAAIITPQWSPDGRWIAYLRRDHGISQVWRANVDGSGAEALTRSPDDISKFRWADDGRTIVYATTGPSFRQAQETLDQEGREGWVYDKRFWPLANAAPWPETPLTPSALSLDIASRRLTAATAAQSSFLVSPARPHADALLDTSDGAAEAWVEPKDHRIFGSPVQLFASLHGHQAQCADLHCVGGIVGLWWLPGDREILYLRQEGWAKSSQLALYRWDPHGREVPHRILQTDDMLVGCVMAGRWLLCGRESARQPRRIVLIDPTAGQDQSIFDPNPEFRSLVLGAVQRLQWRNPRGKESFGDLVLPPDHKAGERHPLIIVQYRSRGFLRGGTGDEYPIFLFAQHGYAVLSFDRTGFYGDDFHPANVDDRTRLNVRNWADRHDILSAIEQGIHRLDDMGLIDMRRIGITGMSDGGSTVQFALLHSHLFAAAATSNCCEDPASSMSIVGPAYETDLVRWSYPRLTEEQPGFWRDYSLAANAHVLDTPLLMQLSDAEFRMALESYHALTALGKPVDLLVFPKEFHNKWQPAHRAAIYRRSVAWFDFWLQGMPPTDNHDRARWCALSARSTVRPLVGTPCG
jgi:dipeptidyl aminopeptidase/acylaminoacyl peptidase